MVGTSHIGPWLTNARQDATTDHGHRPTDGKALGFPKAAIRLSSESGAGCVVTCRVSALSEPKPSPTCMSAGHDCASARHAQSAATPPMLRPGRKADVDPHTRPITSIYLPEEEFAVLVGDLPGLRIHKLRLVSCCRSMRFRTILPSSSW